jgi:oligosaccharide repeat unit polymerase
MMAVYLFSTVVLILTLIRFPFSYVSFVIVSLLLYHINIYINQDMFSDLAMRVIFVATSVFCLPFLTSRRVAPQLGRIELSFPASARNGFIAVLALVVAFSALHYFKVGLPLFNTNLDEARFQAIESGMFGIPSRIAIYGPSIAAFLLLILLNGRAVDLRTFLVSSLTIVILLFIQGSKSSVAQYIIIAAIAYNYLDKKIKNNVNWIIVLIIIFAILGFSFVLERLNSIQDKNFFSYLSSRLTDQSMIPVTALIDEPVRMYLISPFMMINDLLYPFAKITGAAAEASNTQLSRYIYGVKSGNFSVPVTPGFIAYTFRDFGEPLFYFVILFYGYACRYVYFRIGTVLSIYGAWFLLCAQYMLYVGLTSGNLFYLSPNFLMTFAAAYVVERLFSGRQARIGSAQVTA